MAQESSFGNAGVIAPGYVTPWAAPGMPRKLLGHLFSSASPLIFRPGLSAGTWRWAARWLRECKLERYRANRERMQRLAFYSQRCLHALRETHVFEYEHTQGYLQLFRTERDVKMNEPARAMLAENEVPHRLLTADECRKLEPAISTDAQLAGGLHLPRDETGNCPLFTKRLAQIAREMGVTLATETTVLSVRPNVGRSGVTVETASTAQLAQRTARDADAGVIAAVKAQVDKGILFAGQAPIEYEAARILCERIDLPLWPIKGYSITVPVKTELFSPRIAVMDESYKTAITPQGNRLRIAGTAELGDSELVLRERAIATLYKVATDWFPGAGKYREARAWVGARPMLPDGPPVLGATPLPGIFLNVGHGSTGWAMACGSGRVLADVISGQTPEIDLNGLTLARYAH